MKWSLCTAMLLAFISGTAAQDGGLGRDRPIRPERPDSRPERPSVSPPPRSAPVAEGKGKRPNCYEELQRCREVEALVEAYNVSPRNCQAKLEDCHDRTAR